MIQHLQGICFHRHQSITVPLNTSASCPELPSNIIYLLTSIVYCPGPGRCYYSFFPVLQGKRPNPRVLVLAGARNAVRTCEVQLVIFKAFVYIDSGRPDWFCLKDRTSTPAHIVLSYNLTCLPWPYCQTRRAKIGQGIFICCVLNKSVLSLLYFSDGINNGKVVWFLLKTMAEIEIFSNLISHIQRN